MVIDYISGNRLERISVKLQIFKAIHNDMKADDASWDEIQNAYEKKSFDNIEESILEWCEEINENH